VITLNGANTVTLEACVDGYTEVGASAVDYRGYALAVTIGGDTVKTNQPGTYFVTYIATVSDSRTSTTSSKTRTVIVQDTLPPDITVANNGIVESADGSDVEASSVISGFDLGDGSVAVTCDPEYVSLGATLVSCTATDSQGNTASASFYLIVTMNTNRASGAVVDAGGGDFSTPDGSVSVSVPAGALSTETYLTVAETGDAFLLTSTNGTGAVVYGVSIQPHGTTFATPITIVLAWSDTNSDGVVDGTGIQEADLQVTKDGWALAGPCSTCGSCGCDLTANTFTVQVTNLSEFCLVFIDRQGPATANLQTAPFPVPVNTPARLTATVDDSPTGATPIASAEFALDDGPFVTMSAADGTYDQVSETVTAMLPAFTQAGVYAVKVRGWDVMHNVAGPPETLLLPVYDPSAGFVTGGGWIHSPAGAFYPSLPEFAGVVGKASFGFVAKYQKGASVPTGSTEFQFKAGNLNFHSRSYQWLVVAGARAQYKGLGTVNGEGEYGFMLTAIDGQVQGGGGKDRFRIKIWDKASGVILYDNQAATGDEAPLGDATILQGGSVVIHK
jgi:hypothetical protein